MNHHHPHVNHHPVASMPIVKKEMELVPVPVCQNTVVIHIMSVALNVS